MYINAGVWRGITVYFCLLSGDYVFIFGDLRITNKIAAVFAHCKQVA